MTNTKLILIALPNLKALYIYEVNLNICQNRKVSSHAVFKSVHTAISNWMQTRLKIHFHLWNKVIIFSLWKLLWEEGAIILLPPDILRSQKWMISLRMIPDTKITQHPHSFVQWRFIVLLFLNLLCVTRLQPFSVYGWIWLNSFCQSALKFSSSLPLSVRAAITRCQRLGKLVHNRSLLLMVLGAWNSRRGHWCGHLLRKAPLQFA